jgi:hypothetical protein
MNKTETKVKSKRIYYYHIDDLGILYKYITQKDKKFCGSDFENVHIRDNQGYGLSMYEPQSVSRYPRTFEALKKHLIKDREEWIYYWKDEFVGNKIQFGASDKEKLEHKSLIKGEREYVRKLKKAKNYPEIDKVYIKYTFTKEFIEDVKGDYGEHCFDFRNEDKAKESKVEIND